MDERLQFTPAEYKEKLTTFSKDTVDFESFNGLFKYKVNKNDNPMVVEIMDDYFKIYISQKPKVSLWMTHPRNSNFRESFYAKIYITGNNADVKVFYKNFYKYDYQMHPVINPSLRAPTRNL